MKLTEWVPQLAAELRVPAPLVHMKAMQIARAIDITWGAELSATNTDELRTRVRESISGTISRIGK